MTQMEYIPLKTRDGVLIGHARVRDGVVRFSLKGANKGRAVVLTKAGGVPGDFNGGAVVTSRVLAAAIVEDGRMTASGLARGADLKIEELKRRVEGFFGGAAKPGARGEPARENAAPERQAERGRVRDRELNKSAGTRIPPADGEAERTRRTELRAQAGLTDAGEAGAGRVRARQEERAEAGRQAERETAPRSAEAEKTRIEELNNMAAVEGIPAPGGTGALTRERELDATAGLKIAPGPTTVRHTARVEDTALFRDLEKEAEKVELKARPGGDEESLPMRAPAADADAMETWREGAFEKKTDDFQKGEAFNQNEAAFTRGEEAFLRGEKAFRENGAREENAFARGKGRENEGGPHRESAEQRSGAPGFETPFVRSKDRENEGGPHHESAEQRSGAPRPGTPFARSEAENGTAAPKNLFTRGGADKDARREDEPVRRAVPAGLHPLAAAEAGAAPLTKEPPLKDTDSETFFSLLKHSEAVYRSILEPAAPREIKDPLPFSRSGAAARPDWHGEVDALLKTAAPEQRVGVPNPFPHIFPNAVFIKLMRDGRMERLEGDWRRGPERFLILAVPGGYSPMPPPELKGFTRYIRSRAGGFWVKVIEKGTR